MNEEKFVKSNTQYLDLAKEVTTILHNICVEGKTEYNILTVLAGISIGLYMFIKELAQITENKTSDLMKECIQWMEWADSKFNKKVN